MPNCFREFLDHFILSTAIYESSSCSTSLLALGVIGCQCQCLFCFVLFAIPTGKWYYLVVLFPFSQWHIVLSLFWWTYLPFIYVLWWDIGLNSLLTFCWVIYCLIIMNFGSFLYALDTSILSDLWSTNILLSVFCLLIMSVKEQKFLLLMKSNLSVFQWIVLVLYPRNLWYKDFLPCFFLKFIFLGFWLYEYDPFWFKYCIWYEIWIGVHCVDSIVLVPLVTGISYYLLLYPIA